MANDTAKVCINSLLNHPRRSRYWLEDGSLVLISNQDLYKVHQTLLLRLSPTLTKWASQGQADLPIVDEYLVPESVGCIRIRVPDDIGLRNDDLDALLEHLYHDM